MPRGEVVRLTPVVVDVIQLPHIVDEPFRGVRNHFPWRAVAGDRHPPLVVDATVSTHLEVLRAVPVGRFGFVEGVAHAGALYRFLGHAVDAGRLGDSGTVEHCGQHVDDMVELMAQPAALDDPLWPVDDQPVAGAAEV
jgi:hypothetical protein